MPALQDQRKERYCNEYVVDLKRVEAIIRTGCWPRLVMDDPESRASASKIAASLHSDPFVLARIQELEDERNIQTRLYAARVKLNILRIADFLNTTDEAEKKLAEKVLSTMTIKDILSANDKLMKHLGEYKEDNIQKADAAVEMLRRIQAQDDELPSKTAKECNERGRNEEIVGAEAE